MLFRGAESLRVSGCGLASGMANVTDKGSQAAFSLLLFSVSLACKTELSLLLNYAVFLSVSQAYMKILTRCQTSKWRLTALNSTFTDQPDLRNWMSLYALNWVLEVSVISFLLAGEGSHPVLCHFSLSCPKTSDHSLGLCVLFIINVSGFINVYLKREGFHAMIEAKPFLCKESPALSYSSERPGALHS